MGKQKKTSGKGDSPTTARTGLADNVPPAEQHAAKKLGEWLLRDRYVFLWIAACAVLGSVVGFIAGTGSTGFSAAPVEPNLRQQNLGDRIRSNSLFQLMTFKSVWDDWLDRFVVWAIETERDLEAAEYARNPSHPRIFAVLREAVVREKGGYVHPDLGFLVPAPSGAARGLGMVRDSYQKCQSRCLPGTAEEKAREKEERRVAQSSSETYPLPDNFQYRQEEILLKIPLNFQMTRRSAMNLLSGLMPATIQERDSLHELDDAVLLALFLAHERGVGRYSRWTPYIASLPSNPSCGYSEAMRPYMLDAIYALREEIGVDVQGWPTELDRASKYAYRIAEALNLLYGPHIQSPMAVSSLQNIQWALCQVASRATAAKEKYGGLRLVPMLDLINHDENAGEFIELKGTERVKDHHFIDATEDDTGAFIVRSLRHGRRKPLKKGQELLANYNVPDYSPLDWFVSLGFVPPERWSPWEKIEPAFPRVRQDGPFAKESSPTSDLWDKHGPEILKSIKDTEL